MSLFTVESLINFIKMVAIFLMMVQLVPILVWAERRGSAFIQHRFGPNRVGPLGLIQNLADAVKFLTKEEFMPAKGKKFIFYAAPVLALVPAVLAFGSIPLSHPVQWGDKVYYFQSFHFGIGIVFVLGASSLGAYALLMAGWGSNNKYSILGSLRASAQMISYELALGLALVGAIIIYGTFDFLEIVRAQSGPLNFLFMGKEVGVSFLPNWGIFYQPLGALLYFCAIFAETNRLPFDLPEAEGELVAGYHTEYGGLKMLLFYIGEYGHMMVGSALFVTLFFGGYDLPLISNQQVYQFVLSQGFNANLASLLSALMLHVVFLTKVLLCLWVFIWVRWTLPRFRYDQLMDIGWKTMLPWALGNAIVTAIVVVVARMGAA
jgi:NADH-quinone oxidoreductase subunit H